MSREKPRVRSFVFPNLVTANSHPPVSSPNHTTATNLEGEAYYVLPLRHVKPAGPHLYEVFLMQHQEMVFRTKELSALFRMHELREGHDWLESL